MVLSAVFAFIGCFSLIYYAVMVLSYGFNISFSKFWLAAGIMSIAVSYIIKHSRNSKESLAKIFIIVICALSIASFTAVAFVEAKIIAAGNKKAAENADYLIVLGAQVIRNTPSNSLQLRIDGAYEYLKENTDTIAIASGGKGSGEDISEAQAIYNGLVSRGIDKSRIIMEDKSESTLENLRFSREYINENDSVVIVTNKFHILRACGIANKMGYKNLSGLSVPSNKIIALNCYIREFFAIIKDKALNNL